jgi:acyl-CoA hydrolase
VLRMPSGDFAARVLALLRPGDRILSSQGAAEPTPVLRDVLDAAQELRCELLITLTFSDTIGPDRERHLDIRRLGGLGSARRLSSPRVLPVHWSALPVLIASREVPVDVAVVQVSHADGRGRHSLGIDASHSWAALRAARVRIAEVNAQMPWTDGHEPVPTELFDLIVHTDRPLLEVVPPPPSDVDLAIARHAAEFIEDGAVLQAGIGRAPRAVLDLLADRRDLGVHTGLLDDGLWQLIRSGAVTNSRKETNAGTSVTGTLAGGAAMYSQARGAGIVVREATVTHGLVSIARLSRFTAINSALEVDLTGQVNAEWTGGRFVGGVGGLGDFVRGAQLAPAGRSILVLPSTSSSGASRVVDRLHDGTVTVPRSDVDVVVTEWGAAQLRGCDLVERARRLTEVAAPEFRAALAGGTGLRERAVRTQTHA